MATAFFESWANQLQTGWYHVYHLLQPVNYHSVPGMTRYFGVHGLLPGIQISCLYGSCNSDPLKFRTWALTPGVGTCPGHYSIYKLTKKLEKYLANIHIEVY